MDPSNSPPPRTADQPPAALRSAQTPGGRLRGAILALGCALLLGAGANGRPARPAFPAPVGPTAAINLEVLTDYNNALVFTDVFRTSREWIPQLAGPGGPWDTGAPVITDESGWVKQLAPGQAVMTVLLTGQNGNSPTGRYVCLYEGYAGQRGEAFVIGGKGAVVPGSFTPGRFEIEVSDSSDMLTFKIERIVVSDYIRNIRVVMPGFEQSHATTQRFHPAFLQSLEPFGALRFMDWGQTNNSTVARWSDRTPEDYSRTTSTRGAPIELMVDLCNRRQADLWYCIPHQADDDYVARAVELIRDRLEPNLRLYLEYSNEVWNWAFAQAGWAHAKGLQIWPGDSAAWLHYYGLRTAQVMDVAAKVFEDQPSGRLVRVLSTQSANPWAGTESLDQRVGAPGDFAWRHVDALAIAPYFGYALGLPQHEARTQAMSVREVLEFLDDNSNAINGPGGTTETHRFNASARGLALVAYEGGQHLCGVGSVVDNPIITDLFIAANRHPRMRQLYADDLARWSARGGGLFAAFAHTGTPSKWGSWGILERQAQERETAYKWLGVMDWLSSDLR